MSRGDLPLLSRLLLGSPPLPQQPAEEGEGGAVADDGQVADTLSEDSDEGDDEDDDGANLLDNDGSVGDEGPKCVWLEAGIALELLEEGGLVGVVVGVCGS